jgi:small-conductance mechanosensitive channel
MSPEIRNLWLAAAGIFAGSIALGLVVRAVVVHRLSAWAARTATDLDDIVLAAVRRHLPWWFLLAGLAGAARVAPLPEGAVQIVDRICAVGLILSLAMAASTLASALMTRYAAKTETTVATTSLFNNVTRIIIFATAGLLILANVGFSITPLLTALGVGSLAVALAVQPTLSNLFAGMHLALAHPIRVGDYVSLEGGVKGFVVDIGWRATRIRELPNNIIIVPNSRVADMILTNYNLPEPEQAALVNVGVSYGSDLEHVEAVTCDVARQVLSEIQGGVSGFDPFIRYNNFGDSSIDFTVILRVQAFTDRYLVTHEFIKRLKKRFAAEGIEIPFPQRVLQGSLTAVPPALVATKGAAGEGAGR